MAGRPPGHFSILSAAAKSAERYFTIIPITTIFLSRLPIFSSKPQRPSVDKLLFPINFKEICRPDARGGEKLAEEMNLTLIE
jgi:hypothetical protein